MELIKDKKLTRNGLAKMFAEKGFTKGVEVGVCKGTFSKVLCKANPNLELKSVDPYKVMYYEAHSQQWGEEGTEELFNMATNLLKPYNTEIVRESSLEAVRDFDYESIDFVYIDGAHEFDYVMCDIIEWGRRVKKGGIISGHDYCRTHWGVRLAVNTYAEAHKIDVINLTGNRTPSWWFERTW